MWAQASASQENIENIKVPSLCFPAELVFSLFISILTGTQWQVSDGHRSEQVRGSETPI